MPDMYTVEVRRDEWTQVAAASTTGYYQNITGEIAMFWESATNPGTNIRDGILYRPGPGPASGDRFSDTPGVWARLHTQSGPETRSKVVVEID